MYVNNLRLYAKHLRYNLSTDPAGLAEPAHARFLLQGANGSGKTTILEAIASLWDFFGEWIDIGPGRNISGRSRCLKHYLAEADLAAVELKDLLPDGKSLWLGMGKVKDWVDLKDEHPQAEFAGLVQSRGSWEVQFRPAIGQPSANAAWWALNRTRTSCSFRRSCALCRSFVAKLRT